jgi:hypothetical protein
MTKDAYALLEEAMKAWRKNAMCKNDPTQITKGNFDMPLTIKAPADYGWWQATDAYYDETYGIVIEAKLEPYTSKE